MSDYDVIVIGGGLSGLYAARDLTNAGLSVLVLEARDRLGGRTETIEKYGHKFDIGGQWIGDSQKRILELAKEFDLRLFKQYVQGSTTLQLKSKRVVYDGLIPWRLPSSIPYVPAIFTLIDTDMMIKKLDSLSREVPLDCPWEAPNAKEWDSITLDQWERSACWTNESKEMIDLANETILASDASEFSLLYFLWYLHSGGGNLQLLSEVNTGGAQEYRVEEGTQIISIKLGQSVGTNNVKLNSPVRRIEQNEYGVKVHTDNANYRAKYVICAIPPTLAGRIVYSPPMPPIRDQLTQRMPMGCVIKTIVFYKTAWWRTKGLNGMAASSLRGNDDPILVAFDDSDEVGKGFIIGERARYWSTKSQEERKNTILKQYSRLYGTDEALHPIDYVEKNWLEEEYSRGCYVGIMAPGTLTSCGKALREPVGRIFWAGTETAQVWAGYMDGAIEAGDRAAKEVLKELGITTNK